MNRFPIENIDKVNSSRLTDKLSTSRTISLTGDISSSIQFDGSSNVSTEVEIADNSHNHTLANISDIATINNQLTEINSVATTATTLANNSIKNLTINGNTITYTRNDNTTGTITITDNDTKYTNGTGIVLNDNTFSLATVVTAGNAGPTSNATLTYGGTFTVPYVTYDAYGRVTGRTNRTMTMPAASTSGIPTNITTNGTFINSTIITQSSYSSNTKTYTFTKNFLGIIRFRHDTGDSSKDTHSSYLQIGSMKFNSSGWDYDYSFTIYAPTNTVVTMYENGGGPGTIYVSITGTLI